VAPSCDDDDDGKEYLLFLIFLKKTEKKTLKAKVCERRNTKKQLTILFSLFNPPLKNKRGVVFVLTHINRKNFVVLQPPLRAVPDQQDGQRFFF